MTTETTDQKAADQSTQSTDSSKDQSSAQATQAADQSSNAGTTDSTTGAQRTDTGAAGTTPVQEDYDLEISDESPLTEEDLNEIAEQAGRLNLSKDEAVKLITAKESAYKRGEEKVKTEYQSKIEAARKEIMADPIFAEGQREKTFESMARAIETFGDDDMVSLVKSAEFGNNVVLARFLKRLGDAMAPDESSMTGGKGNHGKTEEDGNDGLKVMYPEFFKT